MSQVTERDPVAQAATPSPSSPPIPICDPSGAFASVPKADQCTQVFFDGACPLCRREVAVYQRIQGNAAVAWVDVSVPGFAVVNGPSHAQLLRRFHTLRPDGVWLSGAEAFVYVWRQLPGWRWLARLGDLPGGIWLMERSYRGFLLLRPRLQGLVRRLER